MGRFISADSIVPGSGPLTLSPHDKIAREGWGKPKEGGPANPQQLNRYTYVLNNPLRHADPTGHRVPPCGIFCSPLPWGDIQDWHPIAQGAVIVGCAVIGCSIDESGTIRGPGMDTMLPMPGAAAGKHAAFQIAKEGGRHAGFLKTHANLTIRQLESSIRKNESSILEHLEKIADPARFAKNWDTMSTQGREGLLKYWAKELENFRDKIDILRGLIDEKTQSNP